MVTIHRNILDDLPCLSIQANSHLVNSALFCQQSYQLSTFLPAILSTQHIFTSNLINSPSHQQYLLMAF
ncbi:TPA: hypothetical protein ACGO1J_001968 [Streptococcus suis]